MDLRITLSHKAVDLFITLTAILALIYSGRYGMARALAVFVRPSPQEKWEEESAMRPSYVGIRPLRFCFSSAIVHKNVI
jgi:hypothetical protein